MYFLNSPPLINQFYGHLTIFNSGLLTEQKKNNNNNLFGLQSRSRKVLPLAKLSKHRISILNLWWTRCTKDYRAPPEADLRRL